MAFNPFHSFRKHQKVIFAALTIVCMLTFVLSFGRGDIFGFMGSWFGGGKSTTVGRLYGQKLSAQELAILKQKREIANKYMLFRVLRGRDNIEASLQFLLNKADSSIQQQVQQINFSAMMEGFSIMRGGQDPSEQVPEHIRRLDILISNMGQSPSATDEAKNQQNALISVLRQLRDSMLQWKALGLYRTFTSQGASLVLTPDELYPGSAGLYFGGSLSPEGLMDFLIWKRVADRLGIQLTSADLVREIERETIGPFAKDDEEWVDMRAGIKNSTLIDSILPALADEFRVRMAQAALTGHNPGGFTHTTAPLTPYEQWQFYLKTRTEASVKILPVPVSHFLPEVKEEPKESDLKELFDRYRDREPLPFSETPGFKQPRRVKVEWVETSTTSKYYQKEARNGILSEIAMTPVDFWSSLRLAYGFYNEYERIKYQHGYVPALTQPGVAASFQSFGALHRPVAIASVVGALAAPVDLFSTVTGFQAVATHQATWPLKQGLRGTYDNDLAAGMEREARERSRLAAQIGATGLGLAPLALPAVWFASDRQQDRYLPFEAMRAQLVQQYEEDLAGNYVSKSVEDFKKALEAKRSAKPEEIEKFVLEEVKKRDWKHGQTDKFYSAFQILRMPEVLKELKTAFGSTDKKGKELVSKLFASAPSRALPKLFMPEQAKSGKETYLYWKTADEAAKVLTFEEARSQVVEAWRFQEARKLAKARAEEILKEAREKGKGSPVRILEEAQAKLDKNRLLIDLNNIARLKPEKSPQMFATQQTFNTKYGDYHVDEEVIEFEPKDFLDQIMQLKATGDTTLLQDLPAANFYVVALTLRLEPQVADFYKDTFFQSSSILVKLEKQSRLEYRRQILDRLRQQANFEVEEENRKLLEDRGSGQQDQE
jgi:hypothetical protein